MALGHVAFGVSLLLLTSAAILFAQLPVERVRESDDTILGKPAQWRLEGDALGKNTVAVVAGTPLLLEPWDDAEAVGEAPGGLLSVWDRRPGWLQVIVGSTIGWVRLDDLDTAATAVAEAAGEAKPLEDSAARGRSQPAAPIAPVHAEFVERARRILGGRGSEGRLGPFDLYTDLDNETLLSFLDVVASETPIAYLRLLDLPPTTRHEGAVVLLDRQDDYQELHDQLDLSNGEPVAGFEFGGVAVLLVEKRPPYELARTLIHELTHVLNRRYFAPPRRPGDPVASNVVGPWLEEGLAGNLALSHVDRIGKIHPQDLARQETRIGNITQVSGGAVDIATVARWLQSKRLVQIAELVELERGEFFAGGDRGGHYLQSSALVRFLLTDRDLRASFLGFLGRVRAGDLDSSDLIASLPIEPASLEGRFTEWTMALARGQTR